MGNGFEYAIRLRDFMSSGFARAAANASTFYNRLRSQQQNFLATEPRFTGFFSRLRSSMGGLTGGLAPLIGGLGIVAAFTGFARMGAELEQTRISFEVLTGSVQNGKKLLDELNAYANATPFSNKDLQENGKLLLSFGIAQDKILPTLQMIGDVSGGNAEKLGSMTLAFAQMTSAGKLQGQDLMQMINAGFNPLQEISRTTGQSMAYLKDQMQKGAISAGMVEDAFKTVTSEGGLFFGMMDKQSQTLGGKWSTLTGTIQQGIAEMAVSSGGFFGGIVDFFLSFIQQIKPLGVAFDNFLSAFAPLFKALGELFAAMGFVSEGTDAAGATVGALAGMFNMLANIVAFFVKGLVGLINILKPFAPLIKVLITALVAFKVIMWAVNLVLYANPIMLVVLAIVALIAVIVTVIQKMRSWSQSTSALAIPFKIIISVIDKVAASWNRVKNAFSTGSIGDGIMEIGRTLLDFALSPLQSLLEYASYIPGLGDIAGDSAQDIKNLRRSMGMDVGDDNRSLPQKIDGAIFQLVNLPKSFEEKMQLIHKRTQFLGLSPEKHAEMMIYAEQRLRAAEKNKADNRDKRLAEEAAANDMGGMGASNAAAEAAKTTAEEIVTGGKKQFILNVNIEKIIESLNQNITDGEKAATDIADMVIDQLTRRLNGVYKSIQD